MATRKHRPTGTNAYDRLLASQQRFVDRYHGPRHLLDRLLDAQPVVVQGWRIRAIPAGGWFEVHPDGSFLPTNSPVLTG